MAMQKGSQNLWFKISSAFRQTIIGHKVNIWSAFLDLLTNVPLSTFTDTEKQSSLIGGIAGASGVGLIAIIAVAVLFVKYRIARRFMNRNKVGDLYATKDEQMSRRNAYIQEDDMIEKEDSF